MGVKCTAAAVRISGLPSNPFIQMKIRTLLSLIHREYVGFSGIQAKLSHRPVPSRRRLNHALSDLCATLPALKLPESLHSAALTALLEGQGTHNIQGVASPYMVVLKL